MNAITESNAEMSSATGETGGQSLVVPPPGATPPDSQAATPDTPPLDASLGAGAREDGRAQSALAPPSALAGETGGEIVVRRSSVAVAPPDPAPSDPLEDALAALDRKDYATAQRLFEALGRKGTAAGIEDALAALDRKDYASAHRLFEALGQMGSAGGPAKTSPPAIPAPFKPTPSAPAANADIAQQAAPPLEVIPRVDAAFRRPLPPAEKAKRRGLAPALLGTGLALIIVAGGSVFFSPQIKSAFAHYGGPLKATLALAKSETAAGFASVAGVLKAPLEAITGAGAREEERARDLGAALTQVTIRLDQIERDYAARLDKLGERVDQDASYRVPDIVQRLDRLEQKAAAPAAPISEFTDLVARLDRLEKRAAAAPQPASEFAEITARLDKLERKAAIAVAPSELTAVTTRLDRLEKRLSGAAASSPVAVPPAGPRSAALLARAEPSPPSDVPKPVENQKPLLRNFSIEEVRDGLAVVDTREGPQQVGPGDLIPGAGRVLRIERRNGEWFVVTSLGVIASDPSSY